MIINEAIGCRGKALQIRKRRPGHDQRCELPKGPIQWGREMGDQVLETLKRCLHYGDDRYRPCPLLRHLNSGNAEPGEGQLTDNFKV